MRRVSAILMVMLFFLGASALQAEEQTSRAKKKRAKSNRSARVDQGERESRRTERFPEAPSLPASVRIQRNIVYGSPGGRDLHLDIILRREMSEPRCAARCEMCCTMGAICREEVSHRPAENRGLRWLGRRSSLVDDGGQQRSEGV